MVLTGKVYHDLTQCFVSWWAVLWVQLKNVMPNVRCSGGMRSSGGADTSR